MKNLIIAMTLMLSLGVLSCNNSSKESSKEVASNPRTTKITEIPSEFETKNGKDEIVKVSILVSSDLESSILDLTEWQFEMFINDLAREGKYECTNGRSWVPTEIFIYDHDEDGFVNVSIDGYAANAYGAEGDVDFIFEANLDLFKKDEMADKLYNRLL